ncbi:MAG: leucine-rich repeat protein [Sodaliphilus sp.]
MKKILLSTVFALMALCASAAIGDTFSEGYLSYLVMDDDASTDYPKVWVLGLSAGANNATNITLSIPTTVTHNGITYRVTQIDANAFSGKTNIVQAILCYGITHIGEGAFKNCSKLVTTRMSSSMQVIGNEAFAGCSSLRNVYIANVDPANFTVATSAFPSNSGMGLGYSKASTNIPPYNTAEAFAKFAIITPSSGAIDFATDDDFGMCVTKAPTKNTPGEIQIVGVYGNTTGTYRPADTYTNSVYSYHLVAIANSACKGDSQVKSFDFSNATNLVTIGNYSFSGCTNLTSVNLGSTVAAIGDYAFENASFSSITIPASIRSIGYLALNKCPNLSAISVSNNIAFQSSYGVLYKCLEDDKLDLLCCPAAFPYTAFYEYMFLPQVTVIENYAFAYCTNLNTIHIPYGVQKLKAYLFNAALQEVKIPSSVTEFDAEVFGNASGLQRIYANIAGTPPTITLFPATPANLYVPYGFVSNYKSAGFWKNCVNIQEGSYDVPEACTKTVSGTLLNDVRSGFTITSTAATTINGTSYDGTMKLTSQQAPTEAATLKIPASVSHNSKTYAVTEIDGKVIYETMSYPLTVALGENIKSIGNMAFNNQPYITGLTLNKNLQKIGSYAFYNCGIENRLELPYGIKYVQTSSFAGNKIPAIKIPSSVTNLGYDALKGNTQLAEIVLNNAQSAADESWVLTDIPTSCTLYVPTGTVQQYKNNSKWGTLNVKAGAYDFTYQDKISTIYHVTVTDPTPLVVDGVSYAGKAKYVYHPYIVSSGVTGFTVDRYETYNNQKYLITEYGDSLFYGASKIDVTVRNNPLIERIGAYSFYGSGLTSMEIPATCTEIGKYAFVNARNLNELVMLSNSVPTFNDAFYGANNTGFKCYVNWSHYASYKSKINNWTAFGADSDQPIDRLNAYFSSKNSAEAICIAHPVDWDASGVEAYTVNQVSVSEQIAYTQKQSATPAGTGLLVKGYKKGDVYKLVRPTDTPTIGNNLLVGVTSSILTNVKNVSVGYIFDVPTHTFIRPTSDVYVGAGSAYLKLSNLLRYPSSLTVSGFEVESITGDVNGDGVVNVSDITALVNRILGDTTYSDAVCDINGDGVVNVSDVTALVNLILN